MKQNRTISEQQLSNWFVQENERDRQTREALADVDAGCVVSQQSLQTWADGLGTYQACLMPRWRD